MFEGLLEQLAVVAVLAERIIAFAKPVYQKFEWQDKVDVALSVVVSALACLGWNLDLFAVAGLPLPVEWLGAVVTGVVAGVGSNVIHELIEILKLLRWDKVEG